MYQALYRKWRPRTFDDVVGQSHITDTLKRQVSGDRLSHAYLFTGTRGTGKTTCAKILARAVNCQNPQNGNPCNQCPACLGIENGSILDVLELDAASNNGVDQVRALRDEAVYTPAAVRKRVYIVDEVHMLSTPAFNALLKILEEPPAHLLFILATTELHKVPATIKSRCQQFSFKRILPGQIAQRLEYVAEQEGIDLTTEGATLLARLADGGLRDALSLLDQCSGSGNRVDEQEILNTLGLAGNLETAALMEQAAKRDTAGALETLGRLYGNGKDVGSVLGELSALARDLLLRKTAPRGCGALLTGGYDEGTMRALGEQLSAQRLLQMLELLQKTGAELARSSNRRTDAELCLIRMCDESLDASFAGLSARVANLEARLAGAAAVPAPATQAASAQRPAPVRKPAAEPAPAPSRPVAEDVPPWDVEPRPQVQQKAAAPEPVKEPEPPASQPQRPAEAPAISGGEDWAFWPSFVAGLRGKVPPSVTPYLNNPAKVTGVWKNGILTLWVDTEFTRSMLNKPAVLDGLKQAAEAAFGGQARVSVVTGKAPEPEAPAQPVSRPVEQPQEPVPAADALDELLAFGEQYDNIVIQ
ncbi:DNA polymerase III subunit gamma/tau [Pseudoflavonifractor sp. AF19-9AC]|uniref:DNA polymerase III subunit gamma/tau n=1 Tax=Pseudoflavonifractor sp. AF19-9AC TaxID=2292244 RepID=UPI000E4B4EDC|nr:DNA polymerase III subunit gamma/tau [Pseudoflavonifractor sp. AF19-9AC]RHR11015.1 DNA polymerase III subunit gamma/tau [Pseudoflavonifractor sp. AF19-9AC]